MSKIQTPEEIMKSYMGWYVPFSESEGTSVIYTEDAVNVVKEAQRQAVEYTLEQAAENGKVKSNYVDPNNIQRTIFFEINKESIISLKNQILKDLGHE